MPMINRLAETHAEITEIRRDLHENPELLFVSVSDAVVLIGAVCAHVACSVRSEAMQMSSSCACQFLDRW